MRRVTFLAILVIALAAPMFASTGRNDDNSSSVRSLLRHLLRSFDLEHISLPPG